VPVYASGGWTSYDDDQLVEEMLEMVGEGYTAIKLKVGVEAGKNPRRDVERVRKVREAVGPEVRLLLDANNCWDAATAVQVANRVREFDIFLFEEPVFADDIPGLARFKHGTDIPLGTGEHEYTKFGLRDLLLHEAVDVVQLDGTRAGGYTEMLKVAALTEAWNLKLAPHAMEHIHLQLAAAVPCTLFVERLRIFEPVTAHVFRNAPVPRNGLLPVPNLPGLGLELDMDFVAEHDERG
jgi:L-alanine-DL-glutamate epimerase-like enolase superfamily enzyme